MLNLLTAGTTALLLALASRSAISGEIADADAARKKPLQRCDQMSDKAEIECLQKARERVVEARRKRESAGRADGSATPLREDTAIQARKN